MPTLKMSQMSFRWHFFSLFSKMNGNSLKGIFSPKWQRVPDFCVCSPQSRKFVNSSWLLWLLFHRLSTVRRRQQKGGGRKWRDPFLPPKRTVIGKPTFFSLPPSFKCSLFSFHSKKFPFPFSKRVLTRERKSGGKFNFPNFLAVFFLFFACLPSRFNLDFRGKRSQEEFIHLKRRRNPPERKT